jgi:hypothetical protein
MKKLLYEQVLSLDDLAIAADDAKSAEANKVVVKKKIDTTLRPKPDPKVKKDAWGRPEGAEWYGYDPEKKKYVTGPKVKKDAWGRPEGDEWYGYDPESNSNTDCCFSTTTV